MDDAKITHLLDLITAVPGLIDFYLDNKDKYSFEETIGIFREEYSQKGVLSYDMDLLLKIILEKYNDIQEKSTSGIHFINKSQQVDDSSILRSFREDTNNIFKDEWSFKKSVVHNGNTKRVVNAYRHIDYDSIIEKYIDCDHPYICSKISTAYLNAGKYNVGLVFLQKALTHVFSFPNIYWHNPLALYGCVDALYEFQYLLGPKRMDSLNEKIPGGTIKILKCLYLYLSRAIYMGDSEPVKSGSDFIPKTEAARIDYLNCRANLVLNYKPYFVNIFGLGVNPDIQYISDKAHLFSYAQKYGIDDIYYDDYLDSINMYRFGSLKPNASGGYHDIEDASFSELIQRGRFRSNALAGDLYAEYQKGEFYISHSDLADCIAYIKEILVHEIQIPFAEFLNKRSEAWKEAWKELIAASKGATKSKQEQLKEALYVEKLEAREIKNYLIKNNVDCFYHFTDRKNLESIIKNGGLYSWKYSLDNGIKITVPGGNELSRQYDVQFGLEDYVRLSFCSDHPMSWRLKQKGADLVLLKINTDVAISKYTLFSDINAASKSHHHGDGLNDLNRIDIRATKRRRVSRDDPDFQKHQAEVMVKTFIPIEYIVNIDSPISL